VRAGSPGLQGFRGRGTEEGWFGWGGLARLIEAAEKQNGRRLVGWAEAKGEGNFLGTTENFGFETEAGAARFG